MTSDNNDQDEEAVEIEVENKDSEAAEDSTEDDSAEKEESEEDYKEKWLRAQADYRNLKKEMAEKRDEWREQITFQVLQKFIPVFDNFKKAYEHKPEENEENDNKQWENWAQGMEYILKQFDDILADYDVKKIEAKGQEFKPALHDAIEKKSSEEFEQGVVIEVMEQGYKTEEKVLKPAKVVVSKGSKEQSEKKESDSEENSDEES
jgi:molecular chaperone GrpE